MFSGAPPGPGAADASAAICVRALGALDVDDPVAGEELLRLREHAVGDRLAVLAGAHELGLIGARQALGRDQLARRPELLGEPHHELDVREMSFFGQLAIWYGPSPGVFIISMYFIVVSFVL